MPDVIIIGGGTAGLTAAIYLQRGALRCVVLEKDAFGGRIFPTASIENYPGLPGVSGEEYSEKLRAQAEAFGAELIRGSAAALAREEDMWLVTTRDGALRAPAVILATGERRRTLDIPGEAEFAGRGVSSCAACDGNFFRGKDVAVVGGGDKALDDALLLARLCRSVHLIHRRGEFRAAGGTAALVRATPNISLHMFQTPVRIGGGRRVESITLRDARDGGEAELAVSGVFVAVGSAPETSLCAGIVPLDENGYIAAGEDCITPAPGLFAAGDVRRKAFRQLVTAAADGATAAKAAADYIGAGTNARM
ncbi:MAG: FAD-dependent oxidoreductase [Firmicutes bacterium]|nr:FAD-dependent oxidoreductase [Bacillota bacterium]